MTKLGVEKTYWQAYTSR